MYRVLSTWKRVVTVFINCFGFGATAGVLQDSVVIWHRTKPPFCVVVFPAKVRGWQVITFVCVACIFELRKILRLSHFKGWDIPQFQILVLQPKHSVDWEAN